MAELDPEISGFEPKPEDLNEAEWGLLKTCPVGEVNFFPNDNTQIRRSQWNNFITMEKKYCVKFVGMLNHSQGHNCKLERLK